MTQRLLAACGVMAAIGAFYLGSARADLTLGVSLPLTGAASGLGIPVKSGFALWPEEIAGQKLNLIILDDASDPTAANKNARRFVTEDKVDLIVGSAMTPAALAMVGVAAEAQTVQIAVSPIDLPPGKGEIMLSIDGKVSRWPVQLPDGISTAERHTRTASYNRSLAGPEAVVERGRCDDT